MLLLRRLCLLPLMLASLALTSCAGFDPSNVGSLITAATTTITNPVTATNLYQAQNGYAATLTLADAWRQKCYSAPYATLIADPSTKLLCQNRRTTVRRIQAAKAKAREVLDRAEAFVRNNPTLNAATVVTEFWSAVQAFRGVVPGAPAL